VVSHLLGLGGWPPTSLLLHFRLPFTPPPSCAHTPLCPTFYHLCLYEHFCTHLAAFACLLVLVCSPYIASSATKPRTPLPFPTPPPQPVAPSTPFPSLALPGWLLPCLPGCIYRYTACNHTTPPPPPGRTMFVHTVAGTHMGLWGCPSYPILSMSQVGCSCYSTTHTHIYTP